LLARKEAVVVHASRSGITSELDAPQAGSGTLLERELQLVLARDV
jgi:hypothetical protein